LLVENHDQALQHWRAQGVRQRILVHLDAHHDLWWTPEGSPVDIGNFICRALQEGQLREIFWIVPDPTWESARSRRAVFRHLRKLAAKYPAPAAPVRRAGDQVCTELLGRPVRVCPLRSLPALREPVVLDIDVDFLLIPRVAYRVWDAHAALPWCWPGDVVARLQEGGLEAEMVTISYSVQGGYTPLQWKYLGEELASRLGNSPPGPDTLAGMESMREAALAAQRGDWGAAQPAYEAAARQLPGSAAPWYHLARLCLERGRPAEARRHYQESLRRDPSYRTPYNGGGLWNLWSRRFRDAEQEFLKTLELDAEDAYAHYGLGRLAARKRRWAEAEVCYRRSLRSNSHLVDAHRGLAAALEKQGRGEEAIRSYVRSLELALTGHRPLGAPIITSPEERRLGDPGHWFTHARLARLYQGQGDWAKALHGYRLALGGGYNSALVRARLARLHLRLRNWRGFWQESVEAGKRIPGDVWIQIRRLWIRLWAIRQSGSERA
jgi:tetratricopeptide (TPR) repeat protein